MKEFRDIDPVERSSPKKVSRHSEYKQDLKVDFNFRCGYCNDSDHWTGGWRFFQIDHFIPRKYLVSISPIEYTNLIYSCFFCNNSKRAKWPSKDENIPIFQNEGFVNPRNPEYKEHLCRDRFGNIIHKTAIGKYMIRELKLNLKRHSIIWNLERIEENLSQIEEIYHKVQHSISPELQQKIVSFFFEHRRYQKLLRKEGNG